jgi:hypothetical protein
MILDVNESIRIVGKTCFIKKKEHLSFETTYHPLLGKNGTIRHILGASRVFKIPCQSHSLNI